jgi:cell division protein FtsA
VTEPFAASFYGQLQTCVGSIVFVNQKEKCLILKDLFALDLGTTKFCLARLCKQKDSVIPAIETVCVSAAGMHRGMLSNMEEASSALANLLEIGERQFSTDINKVIVGIAGSHLTSKTTTARIRIPTSKVEPELLLSLAEQVSSDQKDALREILHCIPVSYRLDEREWIRHPVGFSGQYLTGEFFLIEADRHYLSDVVQLCNQNGLEVKRLIAEPYASAAVTCDGDAKQIGVAIADIGGGTTDGIIFKDDRPISSFTINIGGKMMTKDLSIGLGLPDAEAERVKLRYGIGTSKNIETMEVSDISGQRRVFSEKTVYPILAPRIFELAKLIEIQLRAAKCQLGAGLVLTGGGSDIEDICSFMSRVLGIRVSKVAPSLQLENALSNEAGRSAASLASKYATVSGLLFTEVCRQSDDRKMRKNRWAGHYFGQFVNWIKELS